MESCHLDKAKAKKTTEMKESQLMVLQKSAKSKEIKYLHPLTAKEEKLKLLQL